MVDNFLVLYPVESIAESVLLAKEVREPRAVGASERWTKRHSVPTHLKPIIERPDPLGTKDAFQPVLGPARNKGTGDDPNARAE